MKEPDCVWRFIVAVYDFANAWQTLIAALIALGAAWWAGKIAAGQLKAARDQIKVARDQIAENKAQADREREAKLRAARATLPVTLSAVCEYAKSAAQILNAAWPTAARLYPDNSDHRVIADVRPFPNEVLESLERVVEYSDNEDVAERIESILREAQVFVSRTRPLLDGQLINNDWLATHIVQAAALHARAESLFLYARRKRPSTSGDLWDRTIAALNIMQIYNDIVLAKAEELRARGVPPGEADSEEPD